MSTPIHRLLVLPLLVAAGLVALTPGGAAADGARSTRPGVLRMQTVPPLPGVQVRVDGNVARSDAHGRIAVRVRNFLDLESRLVIPEVLVSPDRRAIFDRFRGSPDAGVKRVVEIGLRTVRKVSWSFVERFGAPVPADRITELRLRSSTGEIHHISGAELTQPRWVAESRTQQGPRGLASKQLYFVVDSVVVDGTSVVNRAAQRFVPWEQQAWTIQLLFFKVSFTATDMIFSRQAGDGVLLTRADGRVERLRFADDGTVLVPDLPRGTYEVKPLGGGVSFARPVSISRDQQVMLSVISPLDLGLVILGLLAVAVGLIVAGRPHLARSLVRPARMLLRPGRSLVRPGPAARFRRLPVPRLGRRPDDPPGRPTTPDQTVPVPEQVVAVPEQVVPDQAVAAPEQAAPSVRPAAASGAEPATEPPSEPEPDVPARTTGGRHSAAVAVVALLAVLAPVPAAHRPAHAAVAPPASQSNATESDAAPFKAGRSVVGRAGAPGAVPVLAYYYIWFNPSSWNRAKTDYPRLGRYSSDDTEIMRRHVRMAKAAGIDGFLVSWKQTPQLDARLASLVDISRQEDFKLGIVYQGLDFARNPLPFGTVRADLAHFADRYATEPVFDIFDKPVVVWTGSEKFTAEQIDATVGEARRRLLVLGNAKNVDTVAATQDVLDGQAYYWSSADPLKEKADRKLAAMSEAVKRTDGLWIAPVAPGFDARMIGGRRDVDRRDGDTFRSSFAAAQGSAPDALGVISWNEFSENTHIEPSEQYGERYLDVLADLLGRTVDHDVLMESHATSDAEPWGLPAWAALLATAAAAAVLPLWLVYRRRRARSAVTPPTQRGTAPQVDPMDL
ncbi:endo-1,3-alpha-glucanase family glycosylhydrolase [Micromonospora cathayae]|uniref:Endo-1,3-alpha-glucanase family glycosylhydrolase n=1 Tax=Micromonospora cathayae TaxID=3028804 RepID=A0ABY7ZVG8_9ACTN|nr:endo-1,3-alpha-glucanase family glycosylhydrolase [Micromonospora sp. HUAS 3]WDZ87050.1 endo-1,3-alpha-glucanase family glycosylhydrolase [Micromonospora sp. HUAS 3]